MTEHDNLNVVQTMHYCKADLKTGKPIVVTDMTKNKTKNTKSWILDLYDEDGHPVRVQCIFHGKRLNNSGARAILEVLQ